MRQTRDKIEKAFQISIALKGIHAFLEIIGGFFFLLVSKSFLTELINKLTYGELLMDPHDYIAQHLLQFVQGFSLHTKVFFFLYLFGHGIVKLALVYNLLEEKAWAYPASLVIFSIFLVYQAYLYLINPALLMFILIVFDIFVIALVWLEYRIHTRYLR